MFWAKKKGLIKRENAVLIEMYRRKEGRFVWKLKQTKSTEKT